MRRGSSSLKLEVAPRLTGSEHGIVGIRDPNDARASSTSRRKLASRIGSKDLKE
jgi:hypothetical protein